MISIKSTNYKNQLTRKVLVELFDKMQEDMHAIYCPHVDQCNGCEHKVLCDDIRRVTEYVHEL